MDTRDSVKIDTRGNNEQTLDDQALHTSARCVAYCPQRRDTKVQAIRVNVRMLAKTRKREKKSSHALSLSLKKPPCPRARKTKLKNTINVRSHHHVPKRMMQRRCQRKEATLCIQAHLWNPSSHSRSLLPPHE